MRLEKVRGLVGKRLRLTPCSNEMEFVGCENIYSIIKNPLAMYY